MYAVLVPYMSSQKGESITVLQIKGCYVCTLGFVIRRKYTFLVINFSACLITSMGKVSKPVLKHLLKL